MILVTGATGKVGRQIVEQLSKQGTPVRAVTRHSRAAGLPAGVEVVHADLTDPGSLQPHLVGVDAVFLVWPFTSPDAAATLAPRVVAVLARQVPRIVYLSAHAAAEQPDSFWARVERAIEDSGAQWTFLRPVGFAANALIWADQIRAGDVVRWPYGAAARSLVHERDTATVAVHVLTEEGHAGARYVLTGPATVTQSEQVQAIGTAIGGEPAVGSRLRRRRIRRRGTGRVGRIRRPSRDGHLDRARHHRRAGTQLARVGGRQRRRLSVTNDSDDQRQ